jgi:hypothetical protein
MHLARPVLTRRWPHLRVIKLVPPPPRACSAGGSAGWRAVGGRGQGGGLGGEEEARLETLWRARCRSTTDAAATQPSLPRPIAPRAPAVGPPPRGCGPGQNTRCLSCPSILGLPRHFWCSDGLCLRPRAGARMPGNRLAKARARSRRPPRTRPALFVIVTTRHGCADYAASQAGQTETRSASRAAQRQPPPTRRIISGRAYLSQGNALDG